MKKQPTKQRSILITGCSSGIGLCVARALKDRGYRVFATARKHNDVARLNSMGFESLQLDLDDSRSIKAAVDSVLTLSSGKLFALFNNGAYGQPGAVEDLTRTVVRAQFETNVFGWIELTNLLLPVMRQQGEGRIIQNSSVLGFAAMSYRGAYNASKYAIEGFSDTMRLELANTNIYVSLIEPGPIVSEFRKNAHKAFLDNIDKDHSAHKEHYIKVLTRLESSENSTSFTQGPEEVLKRVIHALEAQKPKARYPVTIPTYAFAWLKRFLPVSWLDKILLRVE